MLQHALDIFVPSLVLVLARELIRRMVLMIIFMKMKRNLAHMAMTMPAALAMLLLEV